MTELLIGGQKIKAGERRTLDIPLPNLYTHTVVPIVIEGLSPT